MFPMCFFDLCKLYFSSQCLPLRPQMSVPLYQALTALNDHDDVEDVVNDDVDTNFEHKNLYQVCNVSLSAKEEQSTLVIDSVQTKFNCSRVRAPQSTTYSNSSNSEHCRSWPLLTTNCFTAIT